MFVWFGSEGKKVELEAASISETPAVTQHRTTALKLEKCVF
jgi:hypothetical protein